LGFWPNNNFNFGFGKIKIISVHHYKKKESPKNKKSAVFLTITHI